jgi:hypothetical protein
MTARILMFGAVAGLVLAAVGAARPTALPAGNLVQNPGAEIGPGVALNRTTVPVKGWETEVTPEVTHPDSSGFTQARYGTHAYFPTRDVAAAIGGGKNFFFAGPIEGQHVAHQSFATQTIAVAGAGPDIDKGGVRACLSGYLGGPRSWPQYAIRVDLEFLDEDGSTIGKLRIGPVTAAHRGSETTLLRRAAERAVPRGTRQVRVVIAAQSTVGGPVYGYADNIAVGLTRGACQPVLTVRCARGALIATVTPSSVSRTTRVRFAVKGGKRTKQSTDARAPFTGRFTMNGLTGRPVVTATVLQAGSGPIVLTKRSRRC